MSSRKRDEDDGLFDEDDEEPEDEEPEVKGPPKKKKKVDRSFFDDAAEESGEEGGSEDEDEESGEEDNNDYVKDDFVVDEDDDDGAAKRKKDDLEDSDEDDEDDSEDDTPRRKGKLKKVSKMRTQLLEDDLDLVREARGEAVDSEAELLAAEEQARKEEIRARDADELRRGLFHDSGDEEEAAATSTNEAARKPTRVKRDVFDEEGLDDFIEDDIGDQGDIMASERMGYTDGENQVSEAQLQEASEIFGTDYLEFMEGVKEEDEEELMGKHEGISYGYESEEDGLSDEDDEDADLFGEDADGEMSTQKAEAIRMKREKKRLARAERRKEAQRRRAEKRKAKLRRVFEPVQLVENFCTDRDDLIRQTDVPERFFDFQSHLASPTVISTDDKVTEEEMNHAKWMVNRIEDIKAEYMAAPTEKNPPSTEITKTEILESIAFAFRFMREPQNLEPAFIKRYRKDYVSSGAVREHLYTLLDEDREYKRITGARMKVSQLIESVTNAAEVDKSKGADSGRITDLKAQLEASKQQVEDSEAEITTVRAELDAITQDDDEDELFGDDNDDKEEEKKKEAGRLTAHLSTLEDLLTARKEKVDSLEKELTIAELQNKALNDPGPIRRVLSKTQREALWDEQDYQIFLRDLDDARSVLDMNAYMKLIKEGNDAIRKKELPILEMNDGKGDQQKRSRRFDRDFYRTCVAEGLRQVCYKYLLPPNRVGIKLEDQIKTGVFDFTKVMPGEEGLENAVNPLKWVAPTVEETPKDFANNLIGSGDLALLSSPDNRDDQNDPLRGCRYVAALELATEPRVRRHLRALYRKQAVLTSKPTKKGLDEIDAFHEYYGIHLIRNKPVSEFFPIDEDQRAILMESMNMDSAAFDKEMKNRRTQSCLLFLNMLKAENTKHITIHVHLPLVNDEGEDWYKSKTEVLMSRSNQDIKSLVNPLEALYSPMNGDSEEWKQERLQVLRFAINNFLIPQFEKELRRDIQDISSRTGVKEAAKNLHKAALEGPYRPNHLMFSKNRFIAPTGDLKVVGVCCSSDPKQATYLAAISETGEATDFLAIPDGTFIGRGEMRERATRFLLQFRPAAIIIGTSGGYLSKSYSLNLEDILKEAQSRWKNRNIQGDDEDDDTFLARQEEFRKFSSSGVYDDYDDEDEVWECNVEFVDDGVSQLFGRSVRSKKEFPDFPVNHKCAISIGRYAKDPLAEYTYAWSVASDAGIFGTEMLYMNVHPMQRLLPRALLLKEYERVLCDAVASVGTDVNAACQFDHLRGLLLFVPGFGPRKAANLKQMLSQRGGLITQRRDLIDKGYAGDIVYNNSAAFLRIRQTEQLVEQYLNPLDDTRVHPDLYTKHKWAAKIAFDALDREYTEARSTKSIKDVMMDSQKEVSRLFDATKTEYERTFGENTFDFRGWNPRSDVPAGRWEDKIDELNLEAYADKIQEMGQGRWHSHFEMLTWEIRIPFADPRDPLERLTSEKLFSLITNETDETLRPGKEVTGKVIQNGDFGSGIKLEGNIKAFIPLRNFSDEKIDAAEEVVQIGQVVTAVVSEVKKDHMTVDLSLKTEDFRKPPRLWERPASLPPIDRHFDTLADSKMENDNVRKREAHIEALQAALGRHGDENEATARKKAGRVMRRACTHPAFRNAKHEEVDAELREGGADMVGEALLRPSSRHSDSLAVHWVVKEGSIKVIEVLEDEKENDASIGKKLKVKDHEFGSIDELLARYISPMNDFVEELINHRKFQDLAEEELDEKLRKEKAANPRAIPYGICWNEMHPGVASLRFVNRHTHHHPISIGPRGFSWGSKIYPSLDKLLNSFKKNPRGVTVTRETVPAPTQTTTLQNDSTSSRSRWGSRPAAPVAAAPKPQVPAWQPPPPAHQPLPPPPLPVAAHNLPPPPAYKRGPPQGLAPPVRPPPPNLPPVPAYDRAPPAYGVPMPPARPPPPPPQPPAFGGGAAPPIGRGRGRTLPAWMSKQS